MNAVVESVDSLTLRLNLGPPFNELPCQEIDMCLLSPKAVSVSHSGTVQLDWIERIYQYPGLFIFFNNVSKHH